jgi:hypothetical protein
MDIAINVRCMVLMAVNVEMAFLWDVMPYSMVDWSHRNVGTCLPTHMLSRPIRLKILSVSLHKYTSKPERWLQKQTGWMIHSIERMVLTNLMISNCQIFLYCYTDVIPCRIVSSEIFHTCQVSSLPDIVGLPFFFVPPLHFLHLHIQVPSIVSIVFN